MVLRLRFPWILLLLVFLFCSCSKESIEQVYNSEEKRPDLVLYNSSYLMGDDTLNPVRLSGSKLSFYKYESLVVIENASFMQTDAQGELIMSGEADKAQVDTVSRNVELSSSVKLVRPGDDFVLQTDNATWNNDENTVRCEGLVEVEFASNSLKGSDFEAEFDKGLYSFSQVEQGRGEI